MGDQAFQKAECAFCGRQIDFPATAGGMTVECPHCHEQTELHPVQKPARNVWTLMLFAGLGIGLAIGVLLVLKPRKKDDATTAPTPSSPTAALAPAEAARPKSPDDLKVLGSIRVEKAKGSRLSYAMGTVTNDSNHQRYGIRVELDLYEQSGNKLSAQASDYRPTLEPRNEWKFRALVLDNKAVTAKVAAIKEEE